MRAEAASQFAKTTPAFIQDDSVEPRAEAMLQGALIGLVKAGFDELTLRQLTILFVIRDGTTSISGIAASLGISMSSTSRSCSMLAYRGFCRGERLGKKKVMSLSPKGEAMIGRAITPLTTKI